MLFMPDSDWYGVEQVSTESFVLRFKQSSGRFWPVDIHRLQPLRLPPFVGKNITLMGPGPVWMYAHAAATLVRGKIKEIRASTLHQGEIVVFPNIAPRRPSVSRPRWVNWAFQHPQTEVRLQVPERSVLLEPGDFMAEIHTTSPIGGERNLVIQGRGSTWMYAAIGAAAAEAGYENITCVIPRESKGIVVFGRDISGMIDQPAVERGVVLGVVGDPNSGKSVLAKLLNEAARLLSITSCKLDCDAASPTPDWYIHLARRDEQTANCLRQQSKLGWTSDMEKTLAESIRSCRSQQRLTIADLPGGNHRVCPRQRIPPGREVLFQEIDRFLILGRRGSEAAEGWRTQLEHFGWDDRVIAILESRSPENDCQIEWSNFEEPWTGWVQGLDRTLNLSSALDATEGQLGRFFDHLLQSQGPTMPI
jgi:hypothetical protein